MGSAHSHAGIAKEIEKREKLSLMALRENDKRFPSIVCRKNDSEVSVFTPLYSMQKK